MISSFSYSDEFFILGKNIFLNKGNCASCHVLTEAKSGGNIGPNLDIIKPTMERVINTVTNGIGVMPAYEDQLSLDEIKAVSYYVSEAVKQ